MKITYCSRSGTTESLAKLLSNELQIESVAFGEPFEDSMEILGTYTWGGGKIPAAFKKWLLEQDLARDFILFGTGVSTWPKFCGALDGLKIIIEARGGRVLYLERFDITGTREQQKEFIETCRLLLELKMPRLLKAL